jgi:hypothetical protein
VNGIAKLGLLTAAAAALIAVPVACWCIDQFSSPNYLEMREYLIGRLSDEQIARAMARAHADVLRQKTAEKKDEEVARARRENACKIAADPVASVRHPDAAARCGCAMCLDEPIEETERQFEDEELLGVCVYVTTRRLARQAGCLP